MRLLWSRTRRAAHSRWVFLLVSKGTVRISEAGASDAGDSGLIGRHVGMLVPGSSAISFDVSGEPAEMIFISLDADDSIISRLRDVEHPLAIEASPVHAAAYSYLFSLTRAMTQVPGESGAEEALWTLTREVALALIQVVVADRPARLSEEDELVARARDGIETHHRCTAFSASTLASIMGVSERTIQLHFRAAGSTVSDEIRRRRAQSAVALIEQDPGLSLETVANRVGFRSREVLRTSVQRYFGVSPSLLRDSERAAGHVVERGDTGPGESAAAD